jgi:hypothetical protein
MRRRGRWPEARKPAYVEEATGPEPQKPADAAEARASRGRNRTDVRNRHVTKKIDVADGKSRRLATLSLESGETLETRNARPTGPMTASGSRKGGNER